MTNEIENALGIINKKLWSEIRKALRGAGITVESIKSITPGLEDCFIEIVSGEGIS